MAHLMREGRVNEDGLFKFLTAANWPRGLQETVLKFGEYINLKNK
jgi:hypothetical protein